MDVKLLWIIFSNQVMILWQISTADNSKAVRMEKWYSKLEEKYVLEFGVTFPFHELDICDHLFFFVSPAVRHSLLVINSLCCSNGTKDKILIQRETKNNGLFNKPLLET